MGAIVNYIGKKAKTEGKTHAEYIMSRTLLAEGEDLYAAMQKFHPTVYVELGGLGRDGMTKKGDADANAKFWTEWVPGQLSKLEKLLQEKSSFTSTGRTVGELYLWAMLHQKTLQAKYVCRDTQTQFFLRHALQ